WSAGAESTELCRHHRAVPCDSRRGQSAGRARRTPQGIGRAGSAGTKTRYGLLTPHPTALMRALGLAHHWPRLLDGQRAASVAEIAEAEGMDVTQVRRVMRLTLLAPEVVEKLVGSPDAVLEKVMRRPWPNGWCAQKNLLREISQG